MLAFKTTNISLRNKYNHYFYNNETINENFTNKNLLHPEKYEIATTK